MLFSPLVRNTAIALPKLCRDLTRRDVCKPRGGPDSLQLVQTFVQLLKKKTMGWGKERETSPKKNKSKNKQRGCTFLSADPRGGIEGSGSNVQLDEWNELQAQ